MPVSDEPREPTGDECSDNAVVYETDGKIGYAIWYPQMGGYSGKAVAVCDKQWHENATSRTGGCIDVYVWHDGEWPFDSESGRSPAEVHHCDAAQFVRFGCKLNRLNKRHKVNAR